MDCTGTSSVLLGSASHCLPLSTPGASPAFSVFLPNCLLQGVDRHVLDLWTGVRDPLLQVARRILTNYSSPATDRPPRDLLLIFFVLVSKVLEPVNMNKDGTRSSMVPASSDLNDWLLLVATGLNWLHSAVLGACDRAVHHGLPSKVQEKALGPLAEEISQFFHQCERNSGGSAWRKNCKLAQLATTAQKSTPRNVWTWKGSAQHSLQQEWMVWSMRRMLVRVLCEKPSWIRALH